MPSISVPNSFFISERNTIYNDWRAAFWRELLSNAVDAGSSRIMIQTKFDAAKLRVDVIDNGSGMSRDVLENVYMRLGASTKGGGEAIGGFGRARILTCFSQDNYRIRSSNFIATGNGAEYEIKETDNHVRGCAVSVMMPENEATAIYRKLEDVLRESSLRCAVMLKLDMNAPENIYLRHSEPDFPGELGENGWSRFKNWSRTGRLFDTLQDERGPWAELFVNEGAKASKHRAIVRVDGMAMYSEYLAAPAQVTINLMPSRAREILTASRDAIRGEFREALQGMFQRISSERLSAFKAKPVEPTITLMRTADTLFRDGLQLGPRPIVEAAPQKPWSAAETHDIQSLAPSAGPEGQKTEERGLAPGQEEDGQVQYPGLKFPLFVYLADPTPAQRQASSRYDGDTWIQPGGEGRNAELLFAAWTAAVSHCLAKLSEIQPDIFWTERGNWAPGFVFDRSMLACYKAGELIENLFLVNPVDENGAARFKLSDPASVKELIAEAIHEVAHLASERHDENFASVMTRLVAGIRDRDIERDIKEGLDQMRQWQNQRAEILERFTPSPALSESISPSM